MNRECGAGETLGMSGGEQRGGDTPIGRAAINDTSEREPTRRGDDIAERLLNLAAGVFKLLPALSKRAEAVDLVKQLERSATAGGANYEEARGAESPADFVHKVRQALKEVRETRYWLRLVERAELHAPTDELHRLIDEAGQLTAILTASAATARRRLSRR